MGKYTPAFHRANSLQPTAYLVIDWQKIAAHLHGAHVEPILTDLLDGKIGFTLTLTRPQPMACQIRYDWRKHKWQYFKADKWIALTSRTKLIA